MSKRIDKWHILNILLTVLAFVLPLLRSWVLAQAVAQQMGEEAVSDVIYKITVVGSIVSVTIGIIVLYNLYKVIFALSSLDVPAKYRYFSQMVSMVLGTCASFWLPVDKLQQMPGLFFVRDIATGIIFLVIIMGFVREKQEDRDAKSHFRKASIMVIAMHIVVGVMNSVGGWLV